MVLLRRAERGCWHTCAVYSFIFINSLIIVGGLSTMSMVLVLQKHPKAPGLAILFLGLGTVFAGLAGLLEQKRSVCIAHGVLCSLSAFGSAVLSLFIFSNKVKIVKQFESPQFDDVELSKFFWSAAWAFLFLFVIEVLGIFFGFLLHCYLSLHPYETLDETRQRRAQGFFNFHKDIGAASEAANTRQAKSLASKMTKKYGKWSHEIFG
ncbi:hypothetical protein KP509_17G031200 [Ceratopteris richardii]|uniref:Uncharacterized protein n=1 Tax=Ceratopteris richardii TaxID=49495 RepID=A0A8T2ST67_CERRI|nr:hypothetical protein KP509_17G031200 [Ceratopteris richardii]KAH7372960.1 hypothetical protein KP509_17G031200 [Ceratopteris richardii]KAH7372961.1 hypothetical protein KP509_17G031200 [Ceratopteris richardii]KAH7372962.1 hypothetical protein KP509_17G031200 [Ceratopteris richardii]KAH7372963.1 hypothetical protein KP509_17G031200 [Ceratopteris richardii]